MATKQETKRVILDLRIEDALLPHWFEEVRQLAVGWVSRMAIVQLPTEWIVRCELKKDDVEGFHEVLQGAWDDFGYGLH